MQLSGSGGRSFNLGESFVEDFGDIKQTDNITIFVANGLKMLWISLGYR